MKRSETEVRQRHARILEMLQQQEIVRNAEFTKALQISEATLRRDLESLRLQGLVKRVHGGALLLRGKVHFQPGRKGQGAAVQNHKKAIARIAASFVRDGDTVFLNGGTTTLEVLHLLSRRGAQVVTNNTVATAIWHSGRRLVCTGGEYNEKTHSFIGALATSLIKKTSAQLAILGVNGISAAHGITTHDYQETLVNRAMIERAGTAVVVADGTKVGQVFYCLSSPLEAIDCLITDSTADPQELARMRAAGLRIILADEEKGEGE